jgi:uncharacterized membrane protein YGL010W
MNSLSRWERMMAFYGAKHQNWANIAIHMTCVPFILMGALVPLARLDLLGLPASYLALGIWTAGYFFLDLGLALASLPMMALVGLGAAWVGSQPSPTWMWMGAGLFFTGYIAQFIGHAIEGRKPALAENFVLAQYSAPLFVVAEWVKICGLRKDQFARVDAEIARMEGR